MLLKDPAYGGKYCSFTPGHANYVDEAEYQALVDAHIAFKDMSADSYLLSAGIASDWPHGRCVVVVVVDRRRRRRRVIPVPCLVAQQCVAR